MTGPEHYHEAERLIEWAFHDESPDPSQTLATAQVHATLALAAATALPAGGSGTESRAAWVRAVHGMKQHGTPEEAAS